MAWYMADTAAQPAMKAVPVDLAGLQTETVPAHGWAEMFEGAWRLDRDVFFGLRRTCAKLCRKSGGDLEQIKFLLGHSSIQTTERYLGSEQELVLAVNDSLGL